MFLLLFFMLTVATILETSFQEKNELTETTEITAVEMRDTCTTETIEEQTAPIIITNGIEKNMLAYKHWTGTYSPEVFKVQINGTEIAQGEQYELASVETPLEIRYEYSFMNGMRKGAKTITYKITDEKIRETILTFSWHDTWKVLVNNATPIKEEKA